jgi:hypothetical protein
MERSRMRTSTAVYGRGKRNWWLEGKVLTALDTGGFAALVEMLTVYHLDAQGGYWQLADGAKDSAGSQE